VPTLKQEDFRISEDKSRNRKSPFFSREGALRFTVWRACAMYLSSEQDMLSAIQEREKLSGHRHHPQGRIEAMVMSSLP